MIIVSGPELPFVVRDASMITSPTGRSVILIGGLRSYSNDDGDGDWDWDEDYSNHMIELAEDSIGDLKWTVIDTKLQHSSYFNEIFSNVVLP